MGYSFFDCRKSQNSIKYKRNKQKNIIIWDILHKHKHLNTDFIESHFDSFTFPINKDEMGLIYKFE